MTARRIVFLGGNGHGAVRLARARAFLPERTTLIAPPYPGFEGGGPPARDFAAFCAEVTRAIEAAAPDLVYATGVGGLIALLLRAEGRLDVPLVLQAPVLWGLETRLMPRVMRALPPARRALHGLFRRPLFRRWFTRRHFVTQLDASTLDRFFAAYDACATLPDLFAWLSPEVLRRLERVAREMPERFADIELWWGDQDRVVPLADWHITRERLALAWPLRVFRGWGHYPMLEHPAAWAEELAHVASA